MLSEASRVDCFFLRQYAKQICTVNTIGRLISFYVCLFYLNKICAENMMWDIKLILYNVLHLKIF